MAGSGTALADSANLPFKVEMPYAGATVTGLTRRLSEVPCGPQFLGSVLVTCSTPQLLLEKRTLSAKTSCQLLSWAHDSRRPRRSDIHIMSCRFQLRDQVSQGPLHVL